MDFIIYVKKHVFLKVVEKAIVDLDASNKNIAPQPLNMLVVYAFARYVAATVWSPFLDEQTYTELCQHFPRPDPLVHVEAAQTDQQPPKSNRAPLKLDYSYCRTRT